MTIVCSAIRRNFYLAGVRNAIDGVALPEDGVTLRAHGIKFQCQTIPVRTHGDKVLLAAGYCASEANPRQIAFPDGQSYLLIPPYASES